MSRGVNKVILLGTLGKDPEVSYTGTGMAVAKFALATNESRKKGDQWEEVTEWHNIKAFGKTAETCGSYLHKGKQVFLEGKLHTDKYEKDGSTRYFTEIIVDRLTLIGSKSEGGSSDGEPRSQSGPSRNAPPPSRMEPEPEYPPDSEDDLPF